MAKRATRSHVVMVRATFDAPLTPAEARYAVWNNFNDVEFYGDGKPDKDDHGYWPEPYGRAKLTVRRSK